jgi:hypothetical protein
LQPAMVPGLLFVAYIVMQYALGMRYAGEGAAILAMLPLLGFLFYALLSIMILPDAFSGSIFVWPQKMDELAPGVVPLQFTFGNVSQSLYLAINVVFAMAVAIFLTRYEIPYQGIVGAYLAGGYVVVALTFWQFANRTAGVPFPDEVLQSNPGWVVVKQSLGSVPRVQGTFSEPAGLAFYLSGLAFCCLWLSIRDYQIMRPNVLLALAIVCMLLSTSTTGLVVLAVGLPLILAVALVGGSPGALARIGKTMAFLLVGGMLVVAPIFALKPGLLDAVNTVVASTLSKGDSGSFDDRSNRDSSALDALVASHGLGVGWGSFRSSSLVPGLAANSGLFGLAMVGWMIVRVYRLGRRGRAASNGHPGQMLVDGFSAALCGQLTAAILSAPIISSLAFFLQLGCVVGVLARMSIEPRMASQLRA